MILNVFRYLCVFIKLVETIQSSNGDELNDCYTLNGYNYCFFTNGSKTTFDEAKQFCQARNSTLPIINNEYIDTKFQQFMNHTNLTRTGDPWIGAKANNPTQLQWQWVDGRKSSVSLADFGWFGTDNWCTSIVNENGVVKLYQNWWINRNFYICECIDIQCNDGFVLNSTCYKTYKTEKVRWFTAVNRCLSTGCQLASFDDHQQFKQIPLSNLPNATGFVIDGKAWIGLMKPWWQWNGHFFDTSEPVLYNKFDVGKGGGYPQPPSLTTSPSQGFECAIVNATGDWLVSYCADRHHVVCLKVSVVSTTVPSTTITTSKNDTKQNRTTWPTSETDGNQLTFIVGLAVGIGIAVLVIIIIIVIIVVIVIPRRRRRQQNSSSVLINLNAAPGSGVKSDGEVVYGQIVKATDLTSATDDIETNAENKQDEKQVIYADLQISAAVSVSANKNTERSDEY